MLNAKHEFPKSEEPASSSPSSLNEKILETDQSSRDATRPPSPTPESGVEHAPEFKRVMSAKDAQAELTRIMTSGDDHEYPTGMKLALISLALCLAVFLMALDNTIVSSSTWDNTLSW
jgi:hypothetical protein